MRVVIRKKELLPDDIRSLTTGAFNPALRPDVLYIPSTVSYQSIARIPYYLSLATFVVLTAVFSYVLISAIVHWSSAGHFRSEGVMILLLMLVLPAILLLLTRLYYKKTQRIEVQLQSGELKLGVWVTATHLLVNDLDAGVCCVAKTDIKSLGIYRSGRPPLAIVIVECITGERVRIVSNHHGYYKRAEELKALLEKHLTRTSVVDKAALTDQFAEFRKLSEYGNEPFLAACDYLEKYANEKQLTDADKQELLAIADEAMSDWPLSQRSIPEEWLFQVYTREYEEDGTYESGKAHLGFSLENRWVLPLGRTLRVTWIPHELMNVGVIKQLLTKLETSHLYYLDFRERLDDACVNEVLNWPKATTLKGLGVDESVMSPEMKERLKQFKEQHQML